MCQLKYIYTYSKTSRNGVAKMKVLKIFMGLPVTKIDVVFTSLHNKRNHDK